MYVHNSVYTSANNFDNGDDYVEDPVTLISKLDINDPLHLHPNDSTALTFLMGLDDSYMQIKSSILSREVLPDVRSTYATISSEESHRVASGSIVGSSQRNQAYAFVSNVPNRINSQRSKQNFNNGTRPNNLNNNIQGGGFVLVCKNCGFNGHSIDICFKIISYPAYFGKKKSGQNIKGKNVSNNNFVESSSSYGFIDEQIIKDNKIGKNVQVNMAGANQDMNYTDKKLDDVLGISHLKIKHDWHYRVGHLTEPVLNVLKDSLQFDNKDQTICCEICQRAKQSRELFPLSDHTSKFLEMSNDDERVDPNLNSDKKSQSDCSHSSVPGGDVNTADFPYNSGNDADRSDDIFAAQDEQVTTLEDNIFSEASKFPHWTDAMNSKMDALLRNDTWDIVDVPKDRKAIGSKWIFKIKYKSSGEIDRYKARLVAQDLVKRKSDNGIFHALLVYVDDIIITGNNVFETEQFKVYLKSKFMIKDLGKLKYFLGIEVVETNKGIRLKQRKYMLDLLSEYGMLACKSAKTHLMSKLSVSNEASDNDPTLYNNTDYQTLMGKLIYLTNTRLDISYVVYCLSQFMHSPLKSHLKIAFKILRYLKSCPDLGIHVIKNSGMNLKAFSDAD
ncbi:ribonuclease H-like domain-containing protein [Tanacetum coccineum]